MKDYYNEDGWLITDEDEDLIDESLIEKYEKEIGDSADIIFMIGTSFVKDQQHEHKPKKRPCLVVVRAPYDHIRGFQITKEAPKDTYRTNNRFFLKDWAKYGLKYPSFINYDHFVDIKLDKRIDKLGRNDIIILHQKVAEDYDKLIKLNKRQKWCYDLLLEAIEKYTGIEPFNPKEQVSADQVESLNKSKR